MYSIYIIILVKIKNLNNLEVDIQMQNFYESLILTTFK